MKKVFCFCLFIAFSVFVSAQKFDHSLDNSIVADQKPDWTSRIFTGGDFGLQFGDVTFIDISPLIG